jgi:hypothetical protein
MVWIIVKPHSLTPSVPNLSQVSLLLLLFTHKATFHGAFRRIGSNEGGGAVVTYCGVIVAFRSIFILFNVGDVKLV